jgi:hypothetical protein
MGGRNVFSQRVVALITGLLLSAGAVGVTQLGGSATATAPDTIQYVQQTGSGGTYIKYVPGDGSKATAQSVTSGGGCATPTPAGAPILAFSARSYPSGYTGASTAAVVGAYKSRTGVCSIPQAWSIENTEGLFFSVGQNALVANRLFSRAQIALEREDKSTTSSPAAVVQFVLRLGTTIVDQSKTFSIAGPDGTKLIADTGTVPTGFDSVELRVTSPSTGSVSVVGPTSTFTLANEICVGDSISTSSTDGSATSGQVNVSITYVGNNTATVCKTYTSFTASAADSSSANGKSVFFGAQQTTGAHLTAHFDWGYFAYCRPDTVGNPGIPTCPTTYIDFGSGFVAETFCPQASPPTTPQWCTTSRDYDYVTIGGVTYTHITEDWDGFGDVGWTFR